MSYNADSFMGASESARYTLLTDVIKGRAHMFKVFHASDSIVVTIILINENGVLSELLS